MKTTLCCWQIFSTCLLFLKKEPEPEIEVIKEEEPEIKVGTKNHSNPDFMNCQVIDPKKSPFLSPATPYLVISFDVKLTDSCWASEIYQVGKVLFVPFS